MRHNKKRPRNGDTPRYVVEGWYENIGWVSIEGADTLREARGLKMIHEDGDGEGSCYRVVSASRAVPQDA